MYIVVSKLLKLDENCDKFNYLILKDFVILLCLSYDCY